jgi:DNA primase
LTPTPADILNRLGIEYLPKSGRLAFRCPIHDDHDPSAAFYLDTNLGHCFSCGYTLDPIQFYAKVTGKTRAQAIRDLERTFGEIEQAVRSVDPILLARSRRAGERHLQTLRHLPRREHAKKGETLDRILLAYERGQVTDARLVRLMSAWIEVIKEEGALPAQTEEGPDLE